MHIHLFEDDRAAQLGPLTLARPAFALTVGGITLQEALHRLAPEAVITWEVRGHLDEVAHKHYAPLAGKAVTKEQPRGVGRLELNARLIPRLSMLQDLLDRAWKGKSFIAHATESAEVLAACYDSEGSEAPQEFDRGEEMKRAEYILGELLGDTLAPLPCLEHPWDIVRLQHDTLGTNLVELLRMEPLPGEFAWIERKGHPGVWTRGGVQLPEQFAADTKAGPILLDDGVSVGPFAYLKGPLFVGADSTIIEHASVKSNTTIGRHCKVGGEVHSTIIESYSNKGHHGFIGHAWIGSWVNLGAGTTNSNLKNTYGDISMEVGGERHSTGMQFLGCLIGDFSKSAINTSIFTGKTVGVSSHLYGFVGANVPSFCNWARTMGQVSEFQLGAAERTLERMFARRGIAVTPADRDLLRTIFEATSSERVGMDDQLGPM